MLSIQFAQQQLNFLNQAYNSLTESVYSALVLQTRLKPYLDMVNLVIDANGIHLDATQLNEAFANKIQIDPENALADMLDLDKYGRELLSSTNWNGLAEFDHLYETLPKTPALAALLSEFNFTQLGDDSNVVSLSNSDDITLANAGDDTLYGNDGDDRLYGQDGNDVIYGGNGNDLLSGGADNDKLFGGYGADVYVYGRGDGDDTILDIQENGAKKDRVQLVGLNIADIAVSTDQQDTLTITIIDTNEKLHIPIRGEYWRGNGVGQINFADGSTWSIDEAYRASVALSSDGDDFIFGSMLADKINGLQGNDTLIGNAGNDVIDGGAGDDVLIGSARWEAVLDNTNPEDIHYIYNQTSNSYDSSNGDDTYLFGIGDGKDTIIDQDRSANNLDTLRFKSGVNPEDIIIKRNNTDLTLSIRGTQDQVTVKDYFPNYWVNGTSVNLIERISFENGTTWAFSDIQAKLLAGSDDAEIIIGSSSQELISGQAGNDTLLGGAGNDTLDGGAGNDMLLGGGIQYSDSNFDSGFAGSDTYRFGRGDGHDTVSDRTWAASDIDSLELKAGISVDDVRLERVIVKQGYTTHDNLRLTIIDTGETITVTDQFGSATDGIEQIKFADGTIWDKETIVNKVLIGNDASNQLLGFENRDDLIIGNGGDDKLIGGSGDDTLDGGAGADVLDGGKGSDTYKIGLDSNLDLIRDTAAAGVDVVEFAENITPEDVTVRWTLSGQMAVKLANGNQFTVYGQPSPYSSAGVEQFKFSDGTIWDRAEIAERATWATDGNDEIVGGYGLDFIDGGLGNDMLGDLDGNVTYEFGIGDGHDEITYGRGRVSFKPGVTQADVDFTRADNDLLMTISATGDSVRLRGWFGQYAAYQTIDGVDFANGTSLSRGDMQSLVDIGPSQEILYGSAGNDTIVGTESDSIIYARDGADVVEGGAGNDSLYGENGNDTLIGGAGRDWLVGGAGQNVYLLQKGGGLDYVTTSDASVANDTVQFGAGVRLQDVSVQLRNSTYSDNPNATGYTNLIVGIGGNDAFSVYTDPYGDLASGAIQRFRFEDGSELTLADMVAMANASAEQTHEGVQIQFGTEAEDEIGLWANSTELNVVNMMGNDDKIATLIAHDIIAAGYGDDRIIAGYDDYGASNNMGDDIVAGEEGNDQISTSTGDDTILFNYGDGDDIVNLWGGLDTLSFGSTVSINQVSVRIDATGKTLLLVDDGNGGQIWLDDSSISNLKGGLDRLQFVDANGNVRVFDFGAWIKVNAAQLMNTSEATSVSFDVTGVELTGTVALAGGLEAIAYAQTGDMFANPTIANTTTSGSDVLYGTYQGDTIDAGEGNDIVMGGRGDDQLNGGIGDDIVLGGTGNDVLSGGTGNDQLYGGYGGDTYIYQQGDGIVTIADGHKSRYFYGEGSIVQQDNDPNILSFGDGITAQDLQYSELDGDLVITFANSPNDRLVLKGYDANRSTYSLSIDIMRFADGTQISADSIAYTGNQESLGDDGGVLVGTGLADTLVGGIGNDEFIGNGGSDKLVGGIGSDTYTVTFNNDGPSETVIYETHVDGDLNRLRLSGNVNEELLQLEFDGQDLLLRVNETDKVRFAGFNPRSNTQAPVEDIYLTNSYQLITFEELKARGIRIIGTPAEDLLNGTQMSDWIIGLESNDTLVGGGGGDVYIASNTNNIDTIIDIETNAADNVLIFDEGTIPSDLTISYEGNFLIINDSHTGGQFRLSGFDAQNPLGPRAIDRFRFGQFGQEISYEDFLSNGFDIIGSDQSDSLVGTALQDRVYGLEGNDVLDATTGSDVLEGGAGNDTYLINLGDGVVTITDDSLNQSANTLRFGLGISAEVFKNNLRYEQTAQGYVLILQYGEADDVVLLNGFNPNDVLGSKSIEFFEFSDGTTVNYETLVSWTFIVEGDSSGNSLQGTSVGDRLYGYSDDDVLEAESGEDVLTGGLGNDSLLGGSGRDAYVFNLGDGNDVIDDFPQNAEGNIITFGPNITRDSVTLTMTGDDLLITYGNRGDSILVRNYEPEGDLGAKVIDQIEFADGATFTVSEFVNHSPVITNPFADINSAKNLPFSFLLPQDLFTDIDGDALFTYVTSNGYSALPSWLKYDANTRTLFGTPTDLDVGDYQISVQAVDIHGASADYNFKLTINGANSIPTVSEQIAAQTATEDTTFSYQIPENAFTDVDAGDVLSYNLSLANGNPLPSWLSYDAATRTISGTPTNSEVGSLSIKVTATDIAGASASQNFTVSVANVNDAPIVSVAIAAQTATEDTAFSYTIPANAFTDVDVGDSLSYSVVMDDGTPLGATLPAWLSYDVATRTLSGVPANGDVGSVQLKLIATDTVGASAVQTLTLDIINVNDTPTVSVALSDQTAIEDVVFSYTIPADAFKDLDAGDVLSYHVTLANGNPLPAWLSYDATTRALSGTPLNENVGALNLIVSATDNSGASISQTLMLNVQNINDAPMVTVLPGNQVATEDAAFSYTLPANAFQDVDAGDTLGYRLVIDNGSPEGGALPSWLSYDAASQTLSGTPINADVGSVTLKLIATDLAGATASQSFTLNVQNVNDAPVVSVALSEQNNLEDSTFSYQIPANAFSDVDVGDVLAFTITLANRDALPNWLKYDAAARTLSGTPLNADVGALNLSVTATDLAGATASQNFILTVSNVNDAPTASIALVSQAALEDSVFTYQIPANAFTDIDVGDSLSYSVAMTNGSALPNWLSYNASTRTLSGTPLNSDVIGNLDIKVVATDTAGATASQVFSLSVTNTNDAPTVSIAIAPQNVLEDSVFNYQIPVSAFADVDVGDTLTYGVTLSNGNSLPSWLSYNANTRTLSGTPTNENVGTVSIKVTATDVAGASASQVFAVNVSNVNDAPVVSVVLAAQTATEDAIFSYTIPANAFNDIDVGDTLNHMVTLANGNPLPSWLSYNAVTRTLSGTPLNTDVGALELKVTAKDIAGATTSQNLTLTVANVNDAPTVSVLVGNQVATQDVAFSYTIPQQAFTDVDVGDVLSYSVTLGNGNPLPSWLTYNATTRTISGTPTNSDVGAIDIKLTAKDLAGASASQVFTLTVNGVVDVDKNLVGTSCSDTLIGGAGNDTINGLAGADTMKGKAGNDTYVVDNLGDVVVEALNEGVDTVLSSVSHTLSNNVENLTLTGVDCIDATGNGLDNLLKGNSGTNTIRGNAGNDTLDGGAGVDYLIGGTGNDVYIVDNSADVVTENSGEGVDTVRSAVSFTLSNNVENLTLTGIAAINATGNALANYLYGNAGNNLLTDTTGGNDILQGGAGTDTLNHSAASNSLNDGGSGNDTITGGAGRDLFIGGTGNDTITTGTGADIISFNKGDGVDTINASTGLDNTLSLGGNFAYSDLSLTKTGNNLVLKMGATDQITFKDWYLSTANNKSVLNLQVIAEAMQGFNQGSTDSLRNNKVENFNFANLVAAFDAQALKTNWQLTDSILTAHLNGGSDTAAIGGDLAYQYGKNSNLTGIGLMASQNVINSANFGSSAQTLNNPSTWQAEAIKLA